jgi:cytosine deaminase
VPSGTSRRTASRTLAGARPATISGRLLYSTPSPCDTCSSAALLYKIAKIVIGENTTFRGPEEYVRPRAVESVILNAPECIKLMEDFITAKPELWNEVPAPPAPKPAIHLKHEK